MEKNIKNQQRKRCEPYLTIVRFTVSEFRPNFALTRNLENKIEILNDSCQYANRNPRDNMEKILKKSTKKKI